MRNRLRDEVRQFANATSTGKPQITYLCIDKESNKTYNTYVAYYII